MLPKEFYLIPEDVFRLGNSQGPTLDNVRSRDIEFIELGGIKVVVANGKGVSVFDREGINQSPMTGWVWRLAMNVALPVGLKLVKDKPNHFCIAPTQNMPLDKYKGLLEELGLKAERVFKKEGKAV